MTMKWQHRLLHAPEGDGGAGGGGTGSLLDTAGTGEAGAPKDGGTNPPPGDASKPGDTSTANDGKGNPAADWRSGLSKELQDNATLKKYTSVEALAGAYLNAQKLIGAEKIAIPGKHATEDDWKKVFSQLGVPETVDKYDVKFKDGFSADEKFVTAFKENAHKAGILPKQAQKLAEWFSDVNAQADAEAKAASSKAFNDTVANLQKEWGDKFKTQVARANKVVLEFGGEGAAKYFSERGFGGDEKVLRMLAKVGDMLYAEDKVLGDSAPNAAQSPEELKREIGKLQSDPAYNDKTHPNHKAAVQDMQILFQKLHKPVDKRA